MLQPIILVDKNIPSPVSMSLADIDNAVAEFANCSLLAVEAGFDGIEIHGAHGYLPNQFINHRVILGLMHMVEVVIIDYVS